MRIRGAPATLGRRAYTSISAGKFAFSNVSFKTSCPGRAHRAATPNKSAPGICKLWFDHGEDDEVHGNAKHQRQQRDCRVAAVSWQDTYRVVPVQLEMEKAFSQ